MANDRPLVVFHADAGVEIGYGHVMRCGALADAFDEAGWRCAFAGIAGAAGDGSEVDWLELGAGREAEPTALRDRWPQGCDLLVVDHYRRDAGDERACRPWARRILVIDDLADRNHDCDFLLDQTLNRQPAEYAPLTPRDCRLFLGPKYALLRRQFAAETAKREATPVRHILVAMGGTDPRDATSAALRWIAAAAPCAEVSVLLGGSAPHRSRIEAAAAASAQRIDVHIDAEDVASLMAAADISIGAAGSTSWERCAMGLPALVVTLAENQRNIAAALDRAGAAVALGDLRNIDDAHAVDTLRRLCADGDGRAEMSRRATEICDGRGAARVAAALAA